MEYRISVHTVTDKLEGWLGAAGREVDVAWAFSTASRVELRRLSRGGYV